MQVAFAIDYIYDGICHAALCEQETRFRVRYAHPGKVRWAARVQIPLEEAAFTAVPAFDADCSSAPHYRIDRGGAEFRAKGGQRPTLRIEHAHSTLAVDEDGEVAGIAIAGHRDVQNLFGLPQECFHNKAYRPRIQKFPKNLLQLAA
jgi:hypothetical protein